MLRLLDPPLGPGDLVLSDFDGTISVQDTGLEIITRLQLASAWELEERWRAGEIGSAECLALQWGLVRLPEAELLAVLDSLELDETFPAFVAFCRERGADLAVLSDGLDLYAERMLRRLGLRPCVQPEIFPPPEGGLALYTNHGEWTPQGVRVTFPCPERECDACGTCKTARLRRLRPGYRRLIYVGDGYSDMCAARHADVRFARSHLADYCRQQGLTFFPFESFAEVTGMVG
jgi:2,3-diketo-5-methylthio-1-phosphopentane phosphatase